MSHPIIKQIISKSIAFHQNIFELSSKIASYDMGTPSGYLEGPTISTQPRKLHPDFDFPVGAHDPLRPPFPFKDFKSRIGYLSSQRSHLEANFFLERLHSTFHTWVKFQGYLDFWSLEEIWPKCVWIYDSVVGTQKLCLEYQSDAYM